jgi:hypothetical protein
VIFTSKFLSPLPHLNEKYIDTPGTGEWLSYNPITYYLDAQQQGISGWRNVISVETRLIPISQVKRTNEVDRKKIMEIVDMMHEEHWFEAVMVKEFESRPGVYFIEDGNHRTCACQFLGFKTIPATVFLMAR